MTVDAAVTPAGYSAASGSPDSNAKIAKGDSLVGRIGNPSYGPQEELRLPTDRPVRGELLQFKPGQRVRAQGGRARMIVPREGLAVQAERVSFENIDFVVEEQTDRPAIGRSETRRADPRAGRRMRFRGLLFSVARRQP